MAAIGCDEAIEIIVPDAADDELRLLAVLEPFTANRELLEQFMHPGFEVIFPWRAGEKLEVEWAGCLKRSETESRVCGDPELSEAVLPGPYRIDHIGALKYA